jgi:hypothetical protein
MGIIEKLFNGDGKQVEVIKKQALEVDALSAPMAAL